MNFKGVIKERSFLILKWGVLSILIGLIAGFIASTFKILLEEVNGIRQNNNKIVFLLPFSGLLIVWLYKTLGMEKDRGTNLILSAVQNGEKVPLRMSLLIFITTSITHLFGGSAGKEGAALQIGGSIANKLAVLFKIGDSERKIATICGMGAGFSAVFGTPTTATVFAMEVASVGTMQYSAIVPCIISSVIGALVSKSLGLSAEFYSIPMIPEYSLINIAKVAIIAMLCGIVSMIFCYSNMTIGKIFSEKIKNPYLRIFIGGTIVVIMSMVFGNTYNGGGAEITHSAFIVSVGFELFIMKILFTSITLGSGFKGGEIVPTFFIGSTLGNALAGVLNLNISFGAGIGMISLFCGVTNCPITSLLMSIEIFGKTESISFFAIACAISYISSGMGGIYSTQRIRYRKLGTL